MSTHMLEKWAKSIIEMSEGLVSACRAAEGLSQ